MTDGTVHLGRRRGRRRWKPVGYGVHRRVLEDEAGPVLELRADLLAWQAALPRSTVFTHLTAAQVLGLWMPPLPEGSPVFASVSQEEQPPRRPQLRVSRISTPLRPVVVGGVRLAPPTEVLLACARDLGVLDLTVLLDCALRRGHVTADTVAGVAGLGRPGSPSLRQALQLADPRSESPWESVLRMFHLLCEVPVVPQREVYDDAGRFVARGDLWLVGTRTLHEYDGAVHRDRRTHIADLARDRALANAGWTRRGYTSGDLLVSSRTMLQEADAAIGRPHDPSRLGPWREVLKKSLFSREGRARLRERWAGSPR